MSRDITEELRKIGLHEVERVDFEPGDFWICDWCRNKTVFPYGGWTTLKSIEKGLVEELHCKNCSSSDDSCKCGGPPGHTIRGIHCRLP